MNETGTRMVAFAGSDLYIEHRGGAAREIVDFVFPGWRDSSIQPTRAGLTVESDASALITVRSGAEVCYQGGQQADAARALQERASDALASGSVRGLLLHAAAVSRNGRVALLPGASGAGKTTLTGRLVSRRHFRYLTDELSFVPDGSRTVHALPRPLNVKASGRSGMSALDEAAGWTILASPVATLLRPPAWGAAHRRGTATLGLAVFPQYQPGAVARLTRLGPAACGLRLMQCLLNARNLRDHGFPAVAALARDTPAYSLVYGDAERASIELESLTRDWNAGSCRRCG
jgi:hypothetical protein